MDPQELILCRHTVTGRECRFPRETLPAWRHVGWLPVDERPADPPSEPDVPAEDVPSPAPSTSTPRKRTAESSKE